MLNVKGCEKCIYLNKDNKCIINHKEEELMEKGDCDCYEEPEIDERIMEVIKQKVDEATPEELEEALRFIESKLKRKKNLTRR